jgi:hypothetical protein
MRKSNKGVTKDDDCENKPFWLTWAVRVRDLETAGARLRGLSFLCLSVFHRAMCTGNFLSGSYIFAMGLCVLATFLLCLSTVWDKDV